ncbi:MAG TPA: hypothetical protein VFZ65_01705, partial [Planctomycetota bacterium]|nr:hypothetical protein [Planctomycetota bacterium]
MNVRPNAGVLARCLFGLAIVGTGSECPGQTPPVVAGLARAGFTARVRGLVLLGELGCTGCHARGAAPVDQRVGPDLAIDVDLVQAGYLERFLADPLATAPGTTMPDLLRGRQPAARREAAEALAHYLQRTFSKVISPVPRDPPPLGTEPPDPDREA